MTTDTTALQERIARALYENAEYYGPAPTQPPWDWRDDEERGEWMEIAAAVLPIIARVRRDAERGAIDGLIADKAHMAVLLRAENGGEAEDVLAHYRDTHYPEEAP